VLIAIGNLLSLLPSRERGIADRVVLATLSSHVLCGKATEVHWSRVGHT
jgi:hypothetical protein